MAKYKYNLSYYDKITGKYIPLNLNSNTRADSTLEVLDKITTNFECLENILSYYKAVKLIPEDINDLFITRSLVLNDGTVSQVLVYNSDKIMYKKDIEKLNFDYVRNLIEVFKKNPDDLLKLCDLYITKYSLSEEKKQEKNYETKYKYFIKMLERVKLLVRYAELEKEKYFDNCSYYKKAEWDRYVKDFMIKEFFRDTKDGKKVNYPNIRDFVIKSDIVLNVKKKIEEQNIDEEEIQDEFLTYEDIKRSNAEILCDDASENIEIEETYNNYAEENYYGLRKKR